MPSQVDSSAISDPFGSKQFMLCPQAMSFFQRLYLAPFSPASNSWELGLVWVLSM